MGCYKTTRYGWADLNLGRFEQVHCEPARTWLRGPNLFTTMNLPERLPYCPGRFARTQEGSTRTPAGAAAAGTCPNLPERTCPAETPLAGRAGRGASGCGALARWCVRRRLLAERLLDPLVPLATPERPVSGK